MRELGYQEPNAGLVNLCLFNKRTDMISKSNTGDPPSIVAILQSFGSVVDE
jgi:hypothetical protein